MLAVFAPLFFFAISPEFYDQTRQLISAGKLDAAATALSSIEARSDLARFRECALLLASRYYAADRATQAVPWIEEVDYPAGTRPMEVSQMLALGYIQSRQFDRAASVMAEIYGVPDKSPAARMLAARMMMREQFEEAAEEQLRKAVTAGPNTPGLHQLLGELALFRSEPEQAIEELRKELTLNPASAPALYKLGDAHTRLDQWDAAMAYLEKSIWLDPSHSGPYILLGKCYMKKQQFASAEGFLRRALRLDPRNYNAHYLLGQTLMELGRTDEGRKMLDRSQQLKKETGQ